MSAKRRNERRKYHAGVVEKIGLGMLALSVLQPIFGRGDASAWLGLVALVISIGLLWCGDYVPGTLEEEE